MTQDNFTILEQISQSPTTSVYKAHQNVLDRTILLKVLHKHLLRDKELVARFSREAKACAILRSENIVQVYDLTDVEGAPAIVMEYVEGKSLEDLLADPHVRSEELLMKVAASVLKALSYAHEKGITHRDIKPGNILVSEDGTVKVTDFGLAAVADAPSLTMEGSLIGTPAYMSPEQARGEAVDLRTDLFSLGVTLVEVLTGDKILVGRSYAECLHKIQTFNLRSIEYLSPQCSPRVYEFLKKMLAPDKHDRFASAGEALAFLEPPAGGDEKKVAPAKKTSRAGSRLLAAGVAVALILVVGLSFVFRHPAARTGKVAADSVASSGPQKTEAKEPGVTPPETTSRDKYSGDKEKRTGSSSDVKSIPQDSISPSASGKNAMTFTATSGDSGYISVQCTPWAKIFIDNEYAGTTPISGSIKILAGEHTVTFSNPNFAPIVKRVQVHRNLLASVEADFLEESGYIIVSVEPWGDVYVDDQFRETTPSVEPIVVSSGTRKIRIHNPSFQDIVKTLTVNPGDTLRLNFSFLDEDGK